MVANLHGIKVVLHIPLSALQENLSIRGIHMNFDHISPNAKSYFQKIEIATENISAGIQGLLFLQSQLTVFQFGKLERSIVG